MNMSDNEKSNMTDVMTLARLIIMSIVKYDIDNQAKAVFIGSIWDTAVNRVYMELRREIGTEIYRAIYAFGDTCGHEWYHRGWDAAIEKALAEVTRLTGADSECLEVDDRE